MKLDNRSLMELNSGRCLTIGPSLRRYQPVVPRAIVMHPVGKVWTVSVFDWHDRGWNQQSGGRIMQFDPGALKNRTQASRALDAALVNLLDGSNDWPETLAELLKMRRKVQTQCKQT